MFSLRPLTARLAGKIRPARRLDWSGFPSEELYPATTSERSVSIASEADYGRIKGTISECDLAEWIQEARGGPQPQPATRRIDLGAALVADGNIYYRGGFEPLRKGLPPFVVRGSPEPLGEVQLASFALTEEFFGHWLIDGSLLLLLAEEVKVKALTPWTPAMTQWSHRSGYSAMLDLPSVKPRLATIDKLWAVDDLGRNPGRAARLRELRKRIRTAAENESGARRVFIRRGLTGVRRHLMNEDEICLQLQSEYGFTIIDPFELRPAALVGALKNAELVMGMEGSHMFHALAAAPDTALIFPIMPATRFSVALKWYSDMIGMRFGFTVADVHGDGFVLPTERLHAALELIGRSL